jgi:hypothetical protein
MMLLHRSGGLLLLVLATDVSRSCNQIWAWSLNQHPTTISRRSLLRQVTGTIKTSLILTTATTCQLDASYAASARPLDAAEAVRRSAANIPGYGQTDIFYPKSWMGTWMMTRQVELPAPREGSEPTRLTLTYPYRFIQSIEDDAVVADRGINQAELEQAVIKLRKEQKQMESQTTTISFDRVQYEWSVNNPNDLRLVMPDSTKKEIKVTKRATERNNDDQIVSSSEFQRLTQEDARGIPAISARRVVSKYKLIDDKTVEGLEIVYDMGGADPLSPNSGVSSSPVVLSKSRIYLVR